ncbi:Protein of unknown function [Microbulbifer donghaiensis]|uniref:Inner membrane protein YgaP-like transmembrane domain-containing protein n=1 Tax=Microbulbifer donghaiensis TaxID=494016 RepID=A0A1M5GS96_9GAMM|nr:DUF2892 domain-containing protein [Microbulbifer donghaiensis]SHG06670.1 Protein of unknown function [Microbulbifer donghaiensis]
MSTERATFVFAGVMLLVSVALTQLVHPNWFWFSIFIGANMIQSAFTGFCPATRVMKMLGIRSEAEIACVAGKNPAVR